MSGEANGPTLLGPNGASARPPKTDAFGRVLKHNATIKEVYEIVAEETAKVHEYYLTQIPQYTAKMIQDALLDLGLCKVVAGAEGVPIIVAKDDPREPIATAQAPAVSANSGGDTAPSDTTEPAP